MGECNSILSAYTLARNKQFLLFPQCFLLKQIIVSPFAHIFAIISLFAAALEELKISMSGKVLRNILCPFPNKPWFLRVWSKSLLKTLWEKKKLFVTSNFFFSQSVFYPFGELSLIFIKLKIVTFKLFQFR